MQSPAVKPVKRKYSGITYHLIKEYADEAQAKAAHTACRAHGIAAIIERPAYNNPNHGLFAEVGRKGEVLPLLTREGL